MNDEKQLIIYFNNGTKMEVSFPVQIKNSVGAVIEAAKRILESDKLVIQTEQQLIIVPWSSVKYVEAASVPAAALPFGTIKGARIITQDKSGQPQDAPPS
ncbi:MAG: hypothetical protein ACLQAH_11470 [Limisphaerales bacterium]